MTTDIAVLNSLGNALIEAAQAPTGAKALGGRTLLKLSKNTGEWIYGVEAEPLTELVAVSPTSFQHGWILWGAGAVEGEHMVPVNIPQGANPGGYSEQRSFEAAGTATGVQLVYKTSALGGIEFWGDLAREIGAHLGVDPRTPVPVLELQSESYTHKQYGKIWKPTFTVVEWRALDDATPPEPEPEPEPEPKPKPEPARIRRRRRA